MTLSLEHFNGSTTTVSRGAVVFDLGELVSGGHRFPTIYADPPWRYRNELSRAAAVNHYATLSLREICALPIGELAAENAHLHLWATAQLLGDALKVIRARGFRYKSCFVWARCLKKSAGPSALHLSGVKLSANLAK